MADQAKITTCCYCGHRCITNMKSLTSKSLECPSCGAPINDFRFVSTQKQERVVPPISQRTNEATPAPIAFPVPDKKSKKSDCKYATLKKHEKELKKLRKEAEKSKSKAKKQKSKSSIKSIWKKLEDTVEDVIDIFD